MSFGRKRPEKTKLQATIDKIKASGWRSTNWYETNHFLTMAPRLPLEVLERIIDDVAADHYNLSSTKACALVCHSFLPLCRKHIFAYVTLTAYSPSTSDDLNHLLLNSPHLAVYIRKLVYFVGEQEFVRKRFLWLLPMFKKLVKLQKLSIRYFPSPLGGLSRLDWMSSSVRKVLLPILHLPTLTSIALSSFRNFALEDLAGCVNLKELEFEFLVCSNGVGKFLETLPTTPAMLERLVIGWGDIGPVQQLCHARRPDGKPIIDFFSLKKITATVARLDSLTELFGMFRNLRKIDLLIKPKPIPDPMDTSTLKGLFAMLKPSLPTLVNIDIRYYINNNDETYDGPLAGLCHELEKMAGQNVVETIKLLVWVLPGSLDCTRWGELDDVLMGSPEGWPALREVSLSLNVSTFRNDSVNLTLRRLPMTKLVESKRVQFVFQVTEVLAY